MNAFKPNRLTPGDVINFIPMKHPAYIVKNVGGEKFIAALMTTDTKVTGLKINTRFSDKESYITHTVVVIREQDAIGGWLYHDDITDIDTVTEFLISRMNYIVNTLKDTVNEND